MPVGGKGLYIINNYFGGWIWISLFFIAFLYVLLRIKRKVRKIVILATIIFFLVFTNPLLFDVLSFGDRQVFYRFFWMLPVTPMASYGLILFCQNKKNVFIKIIPIILVICIGIITGTTFIKSERLNIPDNRYLLDDEFIEISSKIDELYGDNERISLLATPSEFIRLRLFNTKLTAAVPRKVVLSYLNNGKALDDTYLPLLKLMEGSKEYSIKDVKSALKMHPVNCVILPYYEIDDYLLETGFVKVESFDKYELYMNTSME